MFFYTRFAVFFILSILLVACQSDEKNKGSILYRNDSISVTRLIQKGNSIYSQKANYSDFAKSLELYDSAWQIATRTNDTILLAQTLFAKGRAYDAINNNPQKTIDYYTEAARLYALLPAEQIKALYIKHLVAHSYDKVQDSSNCIKILKELYKDIVTKPDSVKKEMRFTVEMALISTVVKNYVFADSILQQLTKREWITNCSTEYDYLNHYYLAKAKINVQYIKNYNALYIDSLETVFTKSRNLNDSIFYSNELWALYKTMGNKAKENYYLNLNTTLFNKFNSPEIVRETKDKLSKIELGAVEEKRKAEIEIAESRKLFIYILLGLLGIISLLAFFLQKRNKEIRRKQKEVVSINQQLQQKNLQNELLNKEIQHRVKNNLQMLISLVYMQENNTQTGEIKKNMQNIRLRIESIANLHQQLMEQTDEVDLKKYIQYLVSNATTIIADNKKVITYLQIEPIQVSQRISFPLGLIINEWVTNSVKHAQQVNDVLEIAVSIANSNNVIKVNYKDNGKPETVKATKKTLGMEIVTILTGQLEGTLVNNNDNFFTYELTIPLIDGE